MEAKKVTFTDARHIARMTRTQVMDYLKISKSTVLRYEQNNKTPKAVIECLLMIGGQCPTFSMRNSFTGWHFGNGFIYSPNGDRFTSGDVLAIKPNKALIQELEKCLTSSKKQVSKKVPSNVIQFPLRRESSKIA